MDVLGGYIEYLVYIGSALLWLLESFKVCNGFPLFPPVLLAVQPPLHTTLPTVLTCLPHHHPQEMNDSEKVRNYSRNLGGSIHGADLFSKHWARGPAWRHSGGSVSTLSQHVVRSSLAFHHERRRGQGAVRFEGPSQVARCLLSASSQCVKASLHLGRLLLALLEVAGRAAWVRVQVETGRAQGIPCPTRVTQIRLEGKNCKPEVC